MTSVLVWMGILSDGVLVFSGRINNLVGGPHIPCHAIMLLYRIQNLSLSYDTFQPTSHKILMNTKKVWAWLCTECAYMADLGSHGRSKFTVCVYCSVFQYCRGMTRGRVAGLIFLRGAPGRIKCPVAPAYAMAWLTSILILYMLNRVSCFGDSMLSMEELFVSGYVRAVMLSLQLLLIIVLYSPSSSSSYKVL